MQCLGVGVAAMCFELTPLGRFIKKVVQSFLGLLAEIKCEDSGTSGENADFSGVFLLKNKKCQTAFES